MGANVAHALAATKLRPNCFGVRFSAAVGPRGDFCLTAKRTAQRCRDAATTPRGRKNDAAR
eukprot:3610303-Lingulodinium_polyedra.AAC.1